MAVKKEKRLDVPAAGKTVYTKKQLAASERFGGQKDLINALLAGDVSYTAEEAEKIIEKYLKGSVN